MTIIKIDGGGGGGAQTVRIRTCESRSFLDLNVLTFTVWAFLHHRVQEGIELAIQHISLPAITNMHDHDS